MIELLEPEGALDPFAAVWDEAVQTSSWTQRERRRAEAVPAPKHWRPWLVTLFPAHFRHPHAPYHEEMWEWVWSIRELFANAREDILELVAEIERLHAASPVCRRCGGEGERLRRSPLRERKDAEPTGNRAVFPTFPDREVP